MVVTISIPLLFLNSDITNAALLRSGICLFLPRQRNLHNWVNLSLENKAPYFNNARQGLSLFSSLFVLELLAVQYGLFRICCYVLRNHFFLMLNVPVTGYHNFYNGLCFSVGWYSFFLHFFLISSNVSWPFSLRFACRIHPFWSYDKITPNDYTSCSYHFLGCFLTALILSCLCKSSVLGKFGMR